MTDSLVLRWVLTWFSIMVMLLTIWMLFTPHALAIGYTFNGLLADGGTITGAFSYDATAGAIATNVRGLSPNQAFGITSSAFTITPVMYNLPTVQSVVTEFCTGNCIFGGPLVTLLTVKGLNSDLRLSWEGATPFTGAFRLSWLRTIDPAVSPNPYLFGVPSGTLTQTAVPEPNAFWSLIMGLAGIGAYRWRASQACNC